MLNILFSPLKLFRYKFRMEREPLKPFKVRHEITVRSSKFTKPAISVCSELGNMFYMDLNMLRPILLQLKAKLPCYSREMLCSLNL